MSELSQSATAYVKQDRYPRAPKVKRKGLQVALDQALLSFPHNDGKDVVFYHAFEKYTLAAYQFTQPATGKDVILIASSIRSDREKYFSGTEGKVIALKNLTTYTGLLGTLIERQNLVPAGQVRIKDMKKVFDKIIRQAHIRNLTSQVVTTPCCIIDKEGNPPF